MIYFVMCAKIENGGHIKTFSPSRKILCDARLPKEYSFKRIVATKKTVLLICGKQKLTTTLRVKRRDRLARDRNIVVRFSRFGGKPESPFRVLVGSKKILRCAHLDTRE